MRRPANGHPASMIIQRQSPALEFLPVEVFCPMALFDHRNAAVHRADQFAEIAADAFLFFYRIGIVRISGREPYRLMRSVLAGDIAKPAMYTLIRIDTGDDMIIHVEVFPVREGRNRFADKIRGPGKAFFIHPVAEPFAQIFDDPKSVRHHGRAYLHARRAEEHELRGVLPGADTADTRHRHFGGDGVLCDGGQHFERDRLDGGAAITAEGRLPAYIGVGDEGIQVDARDGLDGIDEREGLAACLYGGAASRYDRVYVGGQFGDNGNGSHLHHPFHHEACDFWVLANGGAHSSFRHPVRAAEIKLQSMGAGIFYLFDQLVPALPVIIRHQRDDHRPVGEEADTFPDLPEVDLQRPVADQLDIIQAHDTAAVIVDGGVAGGDVLHLAAQRLPHHAAPAGFESAQDIDLFVGRWRTGQPVGVGGANPEEISAEIGHK
jgi:hypothetical protein